MTTELWQFVRKVTWSSMSHHSFCPKISLSMGAKHLGGAFFREERLQDEHLHQGVRYNGWAQRKLACPKPTHIIAKVTKTLQIIVRSFRSSALCRPWKKRRFWRQVLMWRQVHLGFPQPVVGLIVDHSVHVFVHFSCRCFHLRRKVSKYSEKVTDITYEQTIAVLSYRVSL